MKKLICLLLGVIASFTVMSQTYEFDKNHARLAFSAKHFGISNVEGNFKDFSASLKSKSADFSDAVIEMTAMANSINTDNDMRDNDLKSDKWFDIAKYPTLTFKSTSFKPVSKNNYKLQGTITIHGISKPITLDVVYNGKVMNPMTKKNSVGFTVSGKLDRSDFEVGTTAFSSVVGKEIEIRSNVEFIVSE